MKVSNEQIVISASAWMLNSLKKEGFIHEPICPTLVPLKPGELLASHSDSHILIKYGQTNTIVPCSLQNIIIHKHSLPGQKLASSQTLLLVCQYLELSIEDAQYDHWRKYPIGGD